MALVLCTAGAMAQSTINFTFTRNGENATVNVEGADGVEATIEATSPSPQGNATKVGVWNAGGTMATATNVLCPSTNTNATNANTVITFTLTITGLSEDFACSGITFTNQPVNKDGDYQAGSFKEDRNCNFILDVNGENVGTINNEYIGYASGNVANTTSFNNLKLYANEGALTVKLTLYQSSSAGCFYGLTKIALTQPIALNVTEAGHATLYADTNLEIPENVEAYVVSEVNSGFVTLAQVTGVLPANEGIIVKASEGKYNFFQTTEDATAVETNYLEGTIADETISEAAYVLGKVDGVVGLYKATTEGYAEGTFLNNAYRAYLPASAVPTAAQGAASFSFRFGEGTTGVDELKVESGEMKVIYDLTGRKVENITAPGIYVVNGKKVLVK